MIALWILWLLLLAGVGVVWLQRHWQLNHAQREGDALTPDSYPAPAEHAERLSVIIAAKDEAENIERCVRSLLRQDHPNFELIVVNDRSTDETPAILERLAAESGGRLQLVHVQALRPGWFGKANAMREGAARAGGEWLCFSDADCVQLSDSTLSVAVQEARRYQADFLSVLPQLETNTTWERIIQPVCGGVMMIWFRPQQVNDPRSPAAYANGAFMLIRREAYQRFGGHEAVRTVINEDMHMALLCKQHGLRLRVVRGQGLYSVRMYRTFPQIFKGWSRIFFGCFGTWRLLTMTPLVMLVMGLLPWISAAAAWITIAATAAWWPGWWWAVAGVSTAALLAQQSVIARYYRFTGSKGYLAPTYPLAALLVIGMLLNAMTKRAGGSVNWRGTVYRGQAVEVTGGVADRGADRD
jgi:chlorobactene glucosyltransferase